MWRCSGSGTVENQSQKTGPRGQWGEAIHATDNNNHECGQAYCNSCSEDVVLYFGYHCVLLVKCIPVPTPLIPLFLLSIGSNPTL